jgi:hypothetical protein
MKCEGDEGLHDRFATFFRREPTSKILSRTELRLVPMADLFLLRTRPEEQFGELNSEGTGVLEAKPIAIRR